MSQSRESCTYFAANDGAIVSIYDRLLNYYPESFLTVMTFGRFKGNYDENADVYKLQWPRETLFHVADFYNNGSWLFNPYIFGNKLEVDIDGTFEDVCDYLGLPSDQFFEDDVEEIPPQFNTYREWRVSEATDMFVAKREAQEIDREFAENPYYS